MQRIYLVRHAESTHNKNHKVQHEYVPLSNTGIKQAQFLAKRLKSLKIDKIISSSQQRAKHTAEIIQKEINKEIIYTDKLGEIKRPTKIHDKPFDDVEVKKIREILKQNFDNPTYHYSDEENFEDFKKRVKQALDEILEMPENDILVVSHGATLRMILMLLMFKEGLTAREFVCAMNFFKTKNTGITVLDKIVDENRWVLLTWNDHAHLGEIEE